VQNRTVPRLSAIIPATNAPPTLAACIAAIQGADDPPDELIVVDRADRVGPAAARNDGAARATGDVLVFVDADIVVHPDAFTRIRRAFASAQVDAVFGSYDDAPTAPGVVSSFRNLLHHYVHHTSPGEAETFWAGLGAVRKEAFDAVGGFDARRYHQPSLEDVELGMRLVAQGRRIRLDPSIQGTHLKAWTLQDMLRTDFGRRGVPWVQLLLERRGERTALNLGWRHRLSAAAVVAGAVAVAARRPAVATAAAASLVALNTSFYTLLVRRRGPAEAVAGVGLHALHHLAGAAAVPAGALRYWTSVTSRSASTVSPSSRYSASTLTDHTS
jgi:GT2 family glycosyltransferase